MEVSTEATEVSIYGFIKQIIYKLDPGVLGSWCEWLHRHFIQNFGMLNFGIQCKVVFSVILQWNSTFYKRSLSDASCDWTNWCKLGQDSLYSCTVVIAAEGVKIDRFIN